MNLKNNAANNKKVLTELSRLDLNQNDLGSIGVKELTKAISDRLMSKKLTELRLGHNTIDSLGIETIFSKLLQHNIVVLTLDNNRIGDQGCKLVAGSLSSLNQMKKLNLAFNQISTPGLSSLMRALIGSTSLLSLSLSGNTITTSGAISMR